MECVILGILASESYQREKDWLENGCNVFFKFKDNQCKPLSFWTEGDILEYIEKYNVKVSDLYNMGYKRNGCMYCGFGVHLEDRESNRYKKLKGKRIVSGYIPNANSGSRTGNPECKRFALFYTT